MTATFIPQSVYAAPRPTRVSVSAFEVLDTTRRAQRLLVPIINGIQDQEIATETARRAAFNTMWLIRKLPFLKRSMAASRIRQSCPSLNDGGRSDMSRRFHYLHLQGILRVAKELETTAASGTIRELSVTLKTWNQIREFARH
jgi:hypothetical protein